MRKYLPALFAIIGWFAIITQFVLMLQNRVATVGETVIRFFSFFTILTNLLVAIYFTAKASGSHSRLLHTPGTLTAVTVYITVVGLTYQVLLRHVWSPTGMQKIVDELLHSIIPLLVILYWYLAENKKAVRYSQFPPWLIYPLIYLIYILIRGNMSGFYPYPFVSVTELGMQKVLINSFFMLIFFTVLSFAFIGIGKKLDNNKQVS